MPTWNWSSEPRKLHQRAVRGVAREPVPLGEGPERNALG